MNATLTNRVISVKSRAMFYLKMLPLLFLSALLFIGCQSETRKKTFESTCRSFVCRKSYDLYYERYVRRELKNDRYKRHWNNCLALSREEIEVILEKALIAMMEQECPNLSDDRPECESGATLAFNDRFDALREIKSDDTPLLLYCYYFSPN
jgi:hypothetical protein